MASTRSKEQKQNGGVFLSATFALTIIGYAGFHQYRRVLKRRKEQRPFEELPTPPDPHWLKGHQNHNQVRSVAFCSTSFIYLFSCHPLNPLSNLKCCTDIGRLSYLVEALATRLHKSTWSSRNLQLQFPHSCGHEC